MKLKRVSCTQFAGIRDKSVSFDSGLNIIYGENESGKSTLVNLISRTLFQNAHLDRRRDKAFLDLYFPSARRGKGVAGDFADGKLSFEADSEVYTLSKEWGADERCTLSAPDGVLRDPNTIADILKDLLVYGEGVWSELLLSNQRGTDLSLQTILDTSKKTDTKQELLQSVSQAFAESDGLSVDAIEQAIGAQIETLAGKHWDAERQQPTRKTGGGRWTNGLGEILKTYYAMEDATAILTELSRLEENAARTANFYTEKDAEAAAAADAYSTFNTFAAQLTLQAQRKKAAERLTQDLERLRIASAEWPKLMQLVEKASALQEEKEKRALLDLYTKAKELEDDCIALEKGDATRPCPKEAEVSQVKSALRRITALENKLCGMNLTAALQLMGGHKAEITVLRTGETLNAEAGSLAINEAVRISVPGVMELQLTPADVDITDIEQQIAALNTDMHTLLQQYAVSSSDELAELRDRSLAAQQQLKLLRGKQDALLNGLSFARLAEDVAAITEPVRSAEELEQAIMEVCRTRDVTRFIAANEGIIGNYVREYGSLPQLEEKIANVTDELKREEDALSAVADVPEIYRNIADPAYHLSILQQAMDLAQNGREKALTAKTAVASLLESYQQNLSGDPAAEAARAKAAFEECRDLLEHWLHIEEVFYEQKEKLHDNPTQDIADRFAHYLNVIAGGSIASEFPEADKLNIAIYSHDRLLDFDKLSEGTKATVSLAFRLAVLDHLFPDGGVIVLDDPFTDMDAPRTAQACRLLQDCAQRHQIIFLTCKEEYLSALNGHAIRLNESQ